MSVSARHINAARIAAQGTGCKLRETRRRHRMDVLIPIEVIGTMVQLNNFQAVHKKLLNQLCQEQPHKDGSISEVISTGADAT